MDSLDNPQKRPNVFLSLLIRSLYINQWPIFAAAVALSYLGVILLVAQMLEHCAVLDKELQSLRWWIDELEVNEEQRRRLKYRSRKK